MPQLALETFFNQYLWLLIIFFSFYFFSISVVIPRISLLQKSREKVSAKESKESLCSMEWKLANKDVDTDKDSFKFSKLEIVEQNSYSRLAENWNTLNYLNEWLKKDHKGVGMAKSAQGLASKKTSNLDKSNSRGNKKK
jgi:hypothetical protein